MFDFTFLRRIPLLFFLLAFSYANTNCQKKKSETAPTPVSFAKGADISWLTEMEAAGRKFYNAAGTEKECISLLKDGGFNAIRLRVWVNPAGGWNGTNDVVSKALRAKQLGMRLLLNFHYSDTWADPGVQTPPAAWTSYNLANLQQAVFNHTKEVLNALKANGIKPEWVQVGNETNDGMLWPAGKASVNMAAFASLIKSGYEAVKSADDSIQVMVHISNGYDNNLFRWIFDGLKSNGAKWDVIGMSLYPEPSNWSSLNEQCLTNMKDMIERYHTPVMVTEVGMSWDAAAASGSFLTDIISKVQSLPQNKGLGVFYWEPQCYNNWKGYTKGAFDNSGKPTVALDAFK
jgi:arabinogalactan endo-1,4-beta-galactosidase